MLILKEKPFGVDKAINQINDVVYEALNWKTTADFPINYTAYHRAFKNPRDSSGAIIPEAYCFDTDTRKGEYKEVFYDDRLDASSFFYTDNTVNAIDSGSLNTQTISMVFQVDLSRITNNILHRGDEEIHSIVVNAINKASYGDFTALVKTIPDVYSEFDTSQVTFTDMQGFHCFRCDIDVSYDYDCCTDCDFGSDVNFLLLEDGFNILLEDGFKIILE
jgi:hypothetical protein